MAALDSSIPGCRDRARFLAARSAHGGDGLLALPIAACGLRLDDEAVWVAVGLRLGLNLCEPPTCSCGSLVDATGAHAFVYRHAAARTVRHHSRNDPIARAMSSAYIPVCKEPSGLTRTDRKRPEGLSLILWESGMAVA